MLEEDTFVLPESVVIMEYLEERYPEPALLPADPGGAGARAAACAAVRRGARPRLLRLPSRRRQRAARPAAARSTRRAYGFAAIAYLPWILRARDMLGVELPPHVAEWLDEVSERPAVREEIEVLAAL